MKFRKRLLSILLALVLVLAALPLTASASASNFKKVNTYRTGLFTDVSSGTWYAEDVRSAYELGLMQGTGGKNFAPGGTVTLAQAVTMAARIHSIYHTGSENIQQTGSQWYTAYVNYAKRNGILDKDFSDYNANATRAQFAALFARALPASALGEINSAADGSISDVPAAHANAEEIYQLYRAGVLTGSDDGLFRPSSTITRAEAAAIITRMALPDRRVKLADTASAWAGDPALDFTAQMVDGSTFTLSEQAGKVVLVNFWATWCGPCVREMPDIERLYQEYGAAGQVEIIAVNAGESAGTVQAFLAKQGYEFPIAYDTSGTISNAFEITSIPRTIVFNKDGTVSADLTGALSSGNYQRLKSAIDSALGG